VFNTLRWFFEHVLWTWVAHSIVAKFIITNVAFGHTLLCSLSQTLMFNTLALIYNNCFNKFGHTLYFYLSDQHFEVVFWTSMLDLSSTIKRGQIHYYQCRLWSHFAVLLKSDIDVQYSGFNLQQSFKWIWSHFVFLLKSNQAWPNSSLPIPPLVTLCCAS